MLRVWMAIDRCDCPSGYMYIGTFHCFFSRVESVDRSDKISGRLYGLATHVPRRGFPHSFLFRLSLLSLYPNPHLIKMLLPSQNQQVEQISDGGTNISDPSSACNYLVITDFICGRAKCNLITDSYGFPPVACLGCLVRLHPKRILISRCPHGPLINRRVLHFDRFLLSRPSKSFLSLALSEVICMHA